MQRYITTTKLITLPYAKFIDLTGCGVSAVIGVYRTATENGMSNNYAMTDPVYASYWNMLGGGAGLYNISDFVLNYSAWTTMGQIRNTLSTDMAFRFDKATNGLYINVSAGNPTNVTIEYIPRFDNVEEINSDYWIDIVMELATAITKITLGRIRTRYKQNNALWSNDGDTILEEGKSEYNAIIDKLQANSWMVNGID